MMKKILLSLLALLAVAGAKADNEYTLGDELTLEQVKDGTPFVIANAAGNVVVYGTNGNQSALKTPTEAGNSNNAYYFKLTALADNADYVTALDAARNAEENKFDGEATNNDLYLFRVCTLNGENIVPWSLWGNSELYISHCGWTSNCNGLNLGEHKFGADAWYNTIWKVVAEEGGYSLQSQSLGNKNYFSGQGGPGGKAVLKFYAGLKKGEEIQEDPWVCPEGEIDITTLPWVKKDQNCTVDFGANKGNIFGTDSGEGEISYVDITNYSTIKVYGAKGSVVRAFFNRNEALAESKTFIFVFDAINEEGVATFDLSKVVEAQGDYGHMYLNGIKAGPNYNSVATVTGITLIEKPTPYVIATTAGKIGTIALDYPATIEGATLYEVAGFSTTEGLELAEVEGDMVGGTPYIYVASADEVVCTQTGASVEHGDFDCTKGEVGNGLVGCYTQVSPSDWWFSFIRSTGYVIADGKIRNIAQGSVTIPANRCFFDSDKCKNNSLATVKMQLGFAEDATAINGVNAALNGGKIYDMNGREVKSMKKGGIYVVDGMKVSVK